MNKLWTSAALLAGLLAVVGCGQKPADAPGDKKAPEVTKADSKADGDGHGWWCDEHGVVEAECSMCQTKVFKRLKPDEICPKHPDRASEQCFICHPEEREKNAARYRAKYGKEPPEPKDNMPEKK